MTSKEFTALSSAPVISVFFHILEKKVKYFHFCWIQKIFFVFFPEKPGVEAAVEIQCYIRTRPSLSCNKLKLGHRSKIYKEKNEF